jgi:outer membrane protein insertion porin family
MFRPYCPALLLAFGCVSLNAQSALPANDHKAIVQDVNITGVQSIGTSELNDITSALTAKTVGDDKEEVGERLRMAFQDHGYFAVKVNSVRLRVSDPLANPKPVTVEADVSEGPLFHIGELKFTNNHALSAEDLRRLFPIHKNEVFTRGKIGSGLEAVRNAYVKIGYIDITVVPDTMVKPPTVDILMDISEGHQYHMGVLTIREKGSDVGEKLRARWELLPGQPFDATYIQQFLDENRSLLPATFDLSRGIVTARDCERDVVTVFIDLDSEHPTQHPPKDSGCDKKSK